MAEFFIADMHFGNAWTAKRRKFPTAADMDATIAAAWKERVGGGDTVWVLGDIGSLESLRDLPGTKHLIFGNDDKPRGPIKESGDFASLADAHTHRSSHGAMLLVHRPQDAPQDDVPVLHGHTHNAPDEVDLRFVSVSVDKTGWGPITLGEVWRRIEMRRASHELA